MGPQAQLRLDLAAIKHLSVCVLCLTCLDAGGVLELVASGTLALQLPVGHGYSWGTVWADTGVLVAGLWQTQKAAGLVSAGIMTWWARYQDLRLSIEGMTDFSSSV